MATAYNAPITYEEFGVRYDGAGGPIIPPSSTGGMGAGGAIGYEMHKERFRQSILRRRREEAEVLEFVAAVVNLI